MPDSTSTVIDFFTVPESYHKRYWYALGTLVCLLGAIFWFMQTSWFVSHLPAPSLADILKTMEQNKRTQAAIASTYIGNKPVGINLNPMFDADKDPNIMIELDAAKKYLLNDKELRGTLQRDFHASFEELDAEVIPAWHITKLNAETLGITRQVVEGPLDGQGESDVGGFTLVDSDARHPKTVDGRPRVALNPNAFRERKILRLDLFHELLHAMNVPSYYPCRFTYAQNDLTYLPQYREFVARAGLGGASEGWTWTSGVLLFLLMGVLTGCFCRKSHLEYRASRSRHF